MLDMNIELDLRDAIAYNFYVDNVSGIIESCKDKEDYSQGLAVLAKSSYLVAEIFCAARQVHMDGISES
jgi:hypothetical protein